MKAARRNRFLFAMPISDVTVAGHGVIVAGAIAVARAIIVAVALCAVCAIAGAVTVVAGCKDCCFAQGNVLLRACIPRQISL